MSEHATPAQSAAADAPDPRIARAEERLVMLRELAELGMQLARELTRIVAATPDSAEAAPDADACFMPAPSPRRGPRIDPAADFARLSRAVRLTLALEATVEDRLDALRAGEMDSAAEDRDQPWVCHRPFPGDYSTSQRNKVRDAIFNIVDRDVTDLHQARDILETCHERLTESERYDAFGRLPLREAVETICEDLRFQPDWSLWTDEDGWPPSPLTPRQIWDRFWPTPEQLRKRKLQ